MTLKGASLFYRWSLMIDKDYRQDHVGEMMAESENATFVPTKENSAIWGRKD